MVVVVYVGVGVCVCVLFFLNLFILKFSQIIVIDGSLPGSWMKAWQDQKESARDMSFCAEVMFITCSDGSRST